MVGIAGIHVVVMAVTEVVSGAFVVSAHGGMVDIADRAEGHGVPGESGKQVEYAYDYATLPVQSVSSGCYQDTN